MMPTQYRRILLVGLLGVAVALGVAIPAGSAASLPTAPAEAPADPSPFPTTTENDTETSTETGAATAETTNLWYPESDDDIDAGTGNGSNSSAADPDSDGGDSGGGGWIPNIAPPDITGEALDATLGPLLNFWYGSPQLDIGLTDDEPGMSAPQQWPYSELTDLFEVMYALTLLVLVTLVFANVARFTLPTSNNDYRAAKLLARAVGAALMGATGALIITAAGHYVANGVATAIAPDPSTIASDAGSIFKFTAGSLFLVGSFHELGWDLVKWLGIIQSLEWLFLVLFPIIALVLFPAAVYNPRGRFGSLADRVITVWLAVLLANIASALMLATWWRIDWGANLSGVLNVFLSLGFLFGAVILDPILIIIVVFSGSRAMRTSLGYLTGITVGSAVLGSMKQKAAHGTSAATDAAKSRAARGKQAAKSRATDFKSRVRTAGALSRGNFTAAGAERARYRIDEQDAVTIGSDSDSETTAGGIRDAATATDGGQSDTDDGETTDLNSVRWHYDQHRA